MSQSTEQAFELALLLFLIYRPLLLGCSFAKSDPLQERNDPSFAVQNSDNHANFKIDEREFIQHRQSARSYSGLRPEDETNQRNGESSKRALTGVLNLLSPLTKQSAVKALPLL